MCWWVVVMTSTSKSPVFPNVPPPTGSKPSSTYTRFIPREELGDFASWRPDAFAGAAGAAGDPGEPSQAAASEAAADPTPEQWQAQIAAARKSGYQDGYRDGLTALESFKQSFATQATAQVGALLEAFDQQFAALDERLSRTVAQIAVQLARQVLRSEIAAQPALVSRVAAEAVGAIMHSARHITVQVNPADLPLVADGAQEVLQARGARLLANDEIERGGVLVESDVGAIDARIASRWAQAAAALGPQEPWADTEGATP